MTDRPTTLFTFHKIREQGERGDPAAWRAFVEAYGPACLRLLDLYLPPDAGTAGQIFTATLHAMVEKDFERFRAMPRASEREFLSALRALLLDRAAGEGNREAAKADSSEPVLDVVAVARLMEGLPLAHQEILFFKLAGYSDETIERILRISPRVAAPSLERLTPDYAVALGTERDGCPWPRSWLLFLREARSAGKDACPPLYQALRIQDGQVSWYDKEPAEKHVGECLYCLERWTGLREVTYWRHVSAPIPAAQMAEFIPVLPAATASKKPSFFRRVFG
jgi:hypothetical protein